MQTTLISTRASVVFFTIYSKGVGQPGLILDALPASTRAFALQRHRLFSTNRLLHVASVLLMLSSLLLPPCLGVVDLEPTDSIIPQLFRTLIVV